MADTQSNRGISKLLAMIIGRMAPHEQITFDDDLLRRVQAEFPKATTRTVSYALRGLRDKGLLADTGCASVYAKPNGKAKPAPQQPTPTDPELVVIDNLLAAMAAAEPVLKRCKHLLDALNRIR